MIAINITEKELDNNSGSGGLEIVIPGLIGDPQSEDSIPVFIESYEGDIRVIVWNGEPDPQIITLKRRTQYETDT